ncbi:autotransporter outer membrane beta-barrel domain-containing protein [Methylobacterium brachiatum]|uniref:autotransporter outer membrane beta-barrel domain-containing protein n=1 Tax=Methylobacterium brachiatum TaxID=269660 RepID=UPI00244876BC|nr:autotransporter outer membrane beta-barrel domain-containing protein [Methylobacterium brachiatum]MDH2309832.1 autotransporter outer membrane beta-barrel domain-containing protein [Methylobacterium brachiatum]
MPPFYGQLRVPACGQNACDPRQLLVSSVAALTLIAAMPARAAERPVPQVTVGADGRNGQANAFLSNVEATPGENGGDLSLIDVDPASAGRDADATIAIGSKGGRGGRGDTRAWASVPGAKGGRGGAVTATLAEDVTGQGEQVGYVTRNGVSELDFKPIPRFWVYSRGGNGGDAQKDVGGGGDAGPASLTLSSRVSTEGQAFLGVRVSAIGGNAGAGGTDADQTASRRGGAGGPASLTVTRSGQVITDGVGATAVIVESIGGAGSIRGSGTAFSNPFVTQGGAGGTARLDMSGTIRTSGDYALGGLVQSIGGNGGSQPDAGGRPGGRGGDGGTVTVTQRGTVVTEGDYALGLVAQSVGGPGGQGGGGVFGGGSGGDAAPGGTVTLTNSGTVTTSGAGATGLVAQSIGGGSALSALPLTALEVAPKTTGGGAGGISYWFGRGGTGGTGGAGGTATIINEGGRVLTEGSTAFGVLAQSIGGSGGSGGGSFPAGAFFSVGLGGSGGGGGNGGLARFTGIGGLVETAGDGSTAVLVQSIGGGGGVGGDVKSIAVGAVISASWAIGGSGGKGGSGGEAQIESSTTVTTSGFGANGLSVLSIGGGGGVGGLASATAITAPLVTPSGQALPSFAFSTTIGGSGGDGGNGGVAGVINSGLVTTYGDSAIGLLALSVGGGGGIGGDAAAYALAVAPPGQTAVSASSTLGGTGGGGGNGGTVTAENSGVVRTSGDGAIGIAAQSIGGGGGNGGGATATSNSLSLKQNVTVSRSIGGTAGVAGIGGAVTVTQSGSVTTGGADAVGILAQSIGGGGGNGGNASSLAAPGFSFDTTLNSLVGKLPIADSLSVTETIGGGTGKGNAGGLVTVTNRGAITTSGSNAHGIEAQSIGGGGGNGGTVSGSAVGKLAVNLTLGGKGGRGGSGGDVTVINAAGGVIATSGDGSHGIAAQSIGGGGGMGGSVAARDISKPDTVGAIWKQIKKTIGIAAYEEWAKDKTNKDDLDQFLKDIKTSDTYKKLADELKNSDFGKALKSYSTGVSNYLEAQKKGANKLPDASFTLSLGGNGAEGGNGGAVSVENGGTIVTRGIGSHGILAQSIGGGGGQGGLSFAEATNKTNLTATLGGTGGSGNTGGTVKILNTGSVATLEDAAYGLYAQSIGGGGGNGVAGSVTNSSANKGLTLNLTVGGSGGTGANGRWVRVENRGSVTTSGAEAHAVVAQSIGGGGGSFSVPSAGTDDEKTDTAAAENGTAASAKGASEGKSETGAAKKSGGKSDAQALADALLSALDIERIAPPEKPTQVSEKSGSLTLGGSGRMAGDGGIVTVVQSGTIATSGFGAVGILAQSIGGGGGLASVAAGPGGHKYTFGIGGAGGASGNGGPVTVSLAAGAQVSTTGDAAPALLLQSIGGGGGYGGAHQVMGYAVPYALRDGSNGDGGDIRVTLEDGSAIRTTGAQSHGVFTQSLGGGGGLLLDLTGPAAGASGQNRPNSTGKGGDITIDASGSIVASGLDANAIFAQSGVQRTDGSLEPDRERGGRINLRVNDLVTGGSGTGAAIRIDGGRYNTIVIGGRAVVSAASGRAIVGAFSAGEINNYGTVIGDVDLAAGQAGSVTFINGGFQNTSATSAILRTGPDGVIALGPNGRLHNSAILDIGGVGRVARATVTGSFAQSEYGRLLVDVAPLAPEGALRADLLTVTGTASLKGVVEPHLIDGLLPGQYTFLRAGRIMESSAMATGGSIHSGAVPISWSIVASGDSLSLVPRARFTEPTGVTLTSDQRSVAQGLQDAWDGNTTKLGTLYGRFLSVDSQKAYAAALDELKPESNQDNLTDRTLDTRKGLQRAMSCPAFTGTGTLLREGECVWGRITSAHTTQSATADDVGYHQSALSYQSGLQTEFAPDWFFGLTGAYTRALQSDPDRITGTTSDAGDVSAALKHQIGPWLLAASANLGYAWADNKRLIDFGGTTATARSKSGILTAGGRLRASYQVLFGDWYLKPYADLDLLYSYSPAYSETGAPGFNLDMRPVAKTLVAFSPMLEIGGRIDLDEGRWIRPFGTLGVTLLSDDHFTGKASFQGTGALGLFSTESAIPDRLGELGLGFQISLGGGIEVTGEYQGQVGDHFLSHAGTARMQLRF